MPARAKRSPDGEAIVVGGFLLDLSSAVSALTRFILADARRSPVPAHPRSPKACDLASAKPESAHDETDEPRLEVLWCWKLVRRFQQEFELAVGEDILVGVPSCERPSMAIRPSSRRLVVTRHPYPSLSLEGGSTAVAC
jgi:hypothetical protein